MNILELIAREHARMERDLQDYANAGQPAEALALASKVAARIAAYARAEERSLFLSLIVASASAGAVPVELHDRITRQAAQVLAHCAEHGEPLRQAMNKLQRDLRRYALHERTQLRAALIRLFTPDELRQLGGELLLQLAANRRDEAMATMRAPTLKHALTRAWSAAFAPARTGHGSRIRSIPTLRDVLPDGRQGMQARGVS